MQSNSSVSVRLNDSAVELFEVSVGGAVFLGVCYGAVSLVSLAGNACVLWVVVSRRRMRTVTNYFIGNLAMADIVIALFAVPFQFQAALLQRWVLPDSLCAFCPFVQVLSVNVSVFSLAAIAFDRYQAVFHPLHGGASKLKAKLIIFFIWLASAMMASPTAAALRVVLVADEETGNRTRPFCKNTELSEASWSAYQYVLVGLQYVGPLGVISYAYGRMAQKLSGSCNVCEAYRDDIVLKNKKKVIKMLAIVVALFALCWLPYQTYNVAQHLFPSINTYKYINVIWFCAHWLAMSNSCYNPFIYAIYNERFKREFTSQCGCGDRERGPSFDSVTVECSSFRRRSLLFRSVIVQLERHLQEKESD